MNNHSKLTLAVMIASVLSACSSVDDLPKRPSLGEFASSKTRTDTQTPIALSEKERSAKLAKIYQQLLSIEPDSQVRSHVQYRLAQLNTEQFEAQAFGEDIENEPATLALAKAKREQDDAAISKLIADYQSLLTQYPERADNEHIRYQLAKALDFKGDIAGSMTQMKLLLAQFPTTVYRAELYFRQGEIYYNQQDYDSAIAAYANVVNAENNQAYLINSMYMSGWALFKLGELSKANDQFINVLELLVANQMGSQTPQSASNGSSFGFDNLDPRAQNLALDTQRVLSIALSQMQQSNSLVALVNKHQGLTYLKLYRHELFDHLADFLLSQSLPFDAEQTYQAYIKLAPTEIWAARFSLKLNTLYHTQGKFEQMHELQYAFISQFGITTTTWASYNKSEQQELLPHLLSFSESRGRRLYAAAQVKTDDTSVSGFAQAATALKDYLAIAKLANQDAIEQKENGQLRAFNLLPDEYLLADALFEANQFADALNTYQAVAYGKGLYALSEQDDNLPIKLTPQDASQPASTMSLDNIKQQAAYATTVSIRQLMAQLSSQDEAQLHTLTAQQQDLDKQFIVHYGFDPRALVLATHGAKSAFDSANEQDLLFYTDFVLTQHQVIKPLTDEQVGFRYHTNGIDLAQLSSTNLQQIQLVSELYAHFIYQSKDYAKAEQAYQFALNFITPTQKDSWVKNRDLLASSIYLQAKSNETSDPILAVNQYLRVGSTVPESQYALSAEFDAANLLIAQEKWQQAIDVLVPFQQKYPSHELTATVPAKLASAYEALGQWDAAAMQLMAMYQTQSNPALKQEALLTAADYYQKAGQTEQARLAYRTYANNYPEPFEQAQEVRFKLSEIYKKTDEPSKQAFWYRKILSSHKTQLAKTGEVSGRALSLASQASLALGQAHYQSFSAIALKLPLNKSLKRKQTEMKTAIGYYQQVLDFNQAQSVPEATFYLGEMYRVLAKDIMNSDRPRDLDELALEEYELLLEELAYPFEEKAIEIHTSNSERAWQDIYDEWVSKSFKALADLSPALYQKKELTHDVIDTIY